MHDQILMVGSVPLETAEQVFRTFGPALGKWLPYMPDGEIGDRRYWIDGIAYRVLNGHPEIETIKRPAPDANGVENWKPRDIHDQFNFRVKPGIKQVRFGDPGWRLGYARDAVNSYFIFKQLKKDGVIPAHVRFQVCLPLTNSAVAVFFPDSADHPRVVPGFTTALAAEVAKICELIPHDDLAIQWDLSIEHRWTERFVASGDLAGARSEAARVCEPAAEVCAAIPPKVALGHHSCYGTLGGWPVRQPKDLMATVLLLNAVCAAGGRKVDFVHYPTTGSTDEAHFRPLEQLDVGGARSYVGAIHHMHPPGGLKKQLQVVRKFLPDFGVAAPCGFGRVPERPGRLLTDKGDGPPPDYVQVILDDHRAAIKIFEEVMAA